MSYQIGIGVPMPMLLPVTGIFTLPFAGYLTFLANRTVYHRLKSEKYMGDGLADSSDPHTDPLYLTSRAHANFLENVPLAFVFAAVAELNGANRRWLTAAMSTLLALRVAHVELGLMRERSIGLGRSVGHFGSQAITLGLAGYSS
ncbi:hypothetical protein H2201_003897 [Coniosporium apollinis]|uniref:MAPEG family protein n=2 Tax=Coniosporium TaxID=2810619 RepID=A0ABQ9NUC1_9PEZI|nr:hypothetical protein H2199_002285 [Cladosporium sp. JES 115]KAJ9665986.1 hypothetical protein H2201_003897 [Coniosporium apollinis]